MNFRYLNTALVTLVLYRCFDIIKYSGMTKNLPFLRRVSYVFLVGAAIITVFAIVFSFSLYRGALTGKAATELVIDNPTVGTPLSGTFVYDTAMGGPLPAGTTVIVRINTYSKSKPLLDVLSNQGAENFLRLVNFAPKLNVRIVFEDSSSGDINSNSSDVSNDQTSSDTDSSEDSDSGAATFAIIGTQSTIDLQVRAGSNIVIPVPYGKRAVIKEAKKADGSIVDLSNLYLVSRGKDVVLGTSYTEQVFGFSSIDAARVTIDLSRFSFSIPTSYASVDVALVYNEEVLAQAQQSFYLSSEPFQQPQLPQPNLSNFSDCAAFVCGKFGTCSVPDFSVVSQRSDLTLVQSRECIYENPLCGKAFTDTRVCVSSTPLTVIPSTSPVKSSIVQPSAEINFGQELVWAHTFSLPYDLLVTGSAIRELGVLERMEFSLQGARHSVGVVGILDDNLVRVEVSSLPQQATLEVGESRLFDITEDGLADVLVEIISLKDNRATILVAAQNSLSTLEKSEGEKAVTIIKTETKLPVAHVIFNPQSSLVRIFFVQANVQLPGHCYNNIKDNDELGVDCGGTCNACRPDKVNLTLILSWIIFGISAALLILFLRRM